MSKSSSSGGSGRSLFEDLAIPALGIWAVATLALGAVLHGAPLTTAGIVAWTKTMIAKRAWSELTVPLVITITVPFAVGLVISERNRRKTKKADTPLSLQQQLSGIITSKDAWMRTLSPHAALNAASAVRPDLPPVKVSRIRDGNLPPDSSVTPETLIHWATPIGFLADPTVLSQNWHAVLDNNANKLRAKVRRRYPCWVPNELSMLVLGPPRSGKNLTVVNTIAALHDGPVVVTGARSDIVTAVGPYRTMLTGRPVLVIDPEHQLGTAHPWFQRAYIDVLHGCSSPSTAKRRFEALAATKQRIQRMETGSGGDGRGVEEFYVSQAAQILAGLAVAETYEARSQGRDPSLQRIARRFRAVIAAAPNAASPDSIHGLTEELSSLYWNLRLDEARRQIKRSNLVDPSRAVILSYLLSYYNVADQLRLTPWDEAEVSRLTNGGATVLSWTGRAISSSREPSQQEPLSPGVVPMLLRLLGMLGVGLPAITQAPSRVVTDPREIALRIATQHFIKDFEVPLHRPLTTYGVLSLATELITDDAGSRNVIASHYDALTGFVAPLDALWQTLATPSPSSPAPLTDLLYLNPAASTHLSDMPLVLTLVRVAMMLPRLVELAGTYVTVDDVARGSTSGRDPQLFSRANALVPLLELLVFVTAHLIAERVSIPSLTTSLAAVAAPRRSSERVPPPTDSLYNSFAHDLLQWAKAIVQHTSFREWMTSVTTQASRSGVKLDDWISTLVKGNDELTELESMISTLSSQESRADETYRTFMTAFADQVVEIVDSPLVRGITEPSPGVVRVDPYEALDPTSSVFLIGSATNQRLLAPIIVAFISDVLAAASTKRAEQQRERKDGNARLAPPLGLILDEFTSLAPLPPALLNEILTTGSGSGIRLIAVIQSMRLVETSYGEQAARGILDNAGIVIALPGLTEVDTEQLSKRVGTARLSVNQDTGDDDRTTRAVQEQTIIAPHQIAQLPRNLDYAIEPGRRWACGLVLRQGYPALVVEFPAFVEADWYKRSQDAYAAAFAQGQRRDS